MLPDAAHDRVRNFFRIDDVAHAMVAFTRELAVWRRMLVKLALVVPSERLAIWLLGQAADIDPRRMK